MCGVETHAAVLHLLDGRAAKRFNDDAIIKTDAENARVVLWTRRERREKGREEKRREGKRRAKKREGKAFVCCDWGLVPCRSGRRQAPPAGVDFKKGTPPHLRKPSDHPGVLHYRV